MRATKRGTTVRDRTNAGRSRCAPNAVTVTSAAEERANVWTHGLGAAAAAGVTAALVGLAAAGGDPWRIVTLSVFGTTLLAVYGTSTLYHWTVRPGPKRWLRRLDHAAIFPLIAGTYTPLMLVPLGGAWGWAVFGLVWVLAAVGLTLKLCCFHRFGWTQLGLTLGMGWLVVPVAPVLVPVLSVPGLVLIAAGGLAYTGGVGFFLWTRLPYHHAVWHGFVVLGSGCHAAAMFCDVL